MQLPKFRRNVLPASPMCLGSTVFRNVWIFVPISMTSYRHQRRCEYLWPHKVTASYYTDRSVIIRIYKKNLSFNTRLLVADPSSQAVWAEGLLPIACWDCGFEWRRKPGCLPLLSVMPCEVEVSATGRSLFQGSHTDCGLSLCDPQTPIMRQPWSALGCCAREEKKTRLLVRL